MWKIHVWFFQLDVSDRKGTHMTQKSSPNSKRMKINSHYVCALRSCVSNELFVFKMSVISHVKWNKLIYFASDKNNSVIYITNLPAGGSFFRMKSIRF